MASNNEGGAFFAGLVIGGLVGAALALLLAPQSGEETRAQIRDRSLEYKDWAEEGYLETRQRAAEAGRYAQEQAAALGEKGKVAYEKGRQGATAAVEKGKQGVSKVSSRGNKDGSAEEAKATS
jgi:gas vesicle protein